jgi:hypothetical protein
MPHLEMGFTADPAMKNALMTGNAPHYADWLLLRMGYAGYMAGAIRLVNALEAKGCRRNPTNQTLSNLYLKCIFIQSIEWTISLFC